MTSDLDHQRLTSSESFAFRISAFRIFRPIAGYQGHRVVLGTAPLAFLHGNPICMGLLYGRAGRLTAQNGGYGPWAGCAGFGRTVGLEHPQCSGRRYLGISVSSTANQPMRLYLLAETLTLTVYQSHDLPQCAHITRLCLLTTQITTSLLPAGADGYLTTRTIAKMQVPR
jgi:hypothetical protein